MKLLTSHRLTLPKVFLISNREEIKDLPVGVPFIYASESLEYYIVRLLEYEVLYQSALKTGYPFNFKKILKENGYKDLENYWYEHTIYLDYVTSEEDLEDIELTSSESNKDLLQKFVKDSSCYVDIEKLKSLNVFPIWYPKIEEAVINNIHNYSLYDYNLYNKKLGGFYGDVIFNSPKKNLIISDLSGSIPKAVATTELLLIKNLAESLYADVLFTGSKSILYDYNDLYTLNVEQVYDDIGLNNESVQFRKLVTGEPRHYGTCICFGDNHSPLDRWNSNRIISREDAKEMCTWTVDKLISFHTTSNDHLAGYSDFFSPKEVEIIKDWVKYLDKN